MQSVPNGIALAMACGVFFALGGEYVARATYTTSGRRIRIGLTAVLIAAALFLLCLDALSATPLASPS